MKILSLVIMIAGFNSMFAPCIPFSRNIAPYSLASNTPVLPNDSADMMRSACRQELGQTRQYAAANGYSTEYLFIIDMGISSGKKRFFVYNLKEDQVELAGLVAHGSCNTHFLQEARFSNTPNCGCSSLGKYKIGPSYHGEFGKSYRLYGLDSTNSNAFKRGIVLHGFDPVPDREIYPESLCNSFGCPMVSRTFLTKLSEIIDKSSKPVLLWVYE